MAETADELGYLVQCLNGHIHEVKPDTGLEHMCKERAEKGFIDALCLSSEKCPYCIEDARVRGRRNAEMCSTCGCPMNDPCKEQCVMAPPIADSPYEGQIGRFVAHPLDQIMDEEIRELTLVHSYDD